MLLRAKAGKGWYFMRKFLIAILVFIVVVIVAAIVIPFFIDANAYRGKIEAELGSRLGRKVSLGNLHLRLIPFNFQADSITIAEDPHFQTGRPFAQSGQLSVSPRLGPLLHKDVQITSLQLQRPQVELVRDAQGVWNFSTLGKTTAEQPQPATPKGARQNFELDSLGQCRSCDCGAGLRLDGCSAERARAVLGARCSGG